MNSETFIENLKNKSGAGSLFRAPQTVIMERKESMGEFAPEAFMLLSFISLTTEVYKTYRQSSNSWKTTLDDSLN